MRLSCSKVTFENGAALKKPVLFQKKFKEKKFKKKERIIMQLFSADAVVFSKKIEFFFVPKNMKKPPSKVVRNLPPTFLCTAH